MITAKRNIAPVILIGILCIPTITFFYFEIHQRFVQHEMVEKLERAHLETITLHNNAVRWYKKNKEIIVNSTLFDVHRYHVSEDSTVFTGLFDTKETELKKRVKKLFEQKSENDAPRELIVAKLILHLWIVERHNIHGLSLSAPIRGYHNIPSENLLTGDILVPFPPPKAPHKV